MSNVYLDYKIKENVKTEFVILVNRLLPSNLLIYCLVYLLVGLLTLFNKYAHSVSIGQFSEQFKDATFLTDKIVLSVYMDLAN